MSSVATPELLSPNNHRYINLIGGLGSAGVLRVGGIVADYTRYQPNGTSIAERQNTIINHADLERFGEFLEAIGWSVIWSVNFAQGSLQDAIVEARAVAGVLKSRLLALELGNEVENYGHGEKPFRLPPYNYDRYRAEFSEWHAAIQKAVPGIRFAAPDTASSIDWVERMASDARGDVQLLTTHYYRGNQRFGTREQLLHPDPHLEDVLLRLHAVSERAGIPWRMCETNSFFGGGRPDVSDTFVGALWTLDYMLLLAQHGCAGVNIETGVNQLGFISSYSPIQDDLKGTNTAGAPYYGMLAFAAASAGCNQLLPIDANLPGIDLTIYALGSGGKARSIVVINKDDSQDSLLSTKELGIESAIALRLSAPSPDSKTGITLGNSEVSPNGRWTARSKETIHDGAVTVPRMSAVVLRSSTSEAQ
ncbi:glycosyl hydrolase family 79 C-terminal domain-containing protein [Silvibacterium acidisoli]|uniref:glycosyl hydrolase family 79 C-terminal domain-containing protein n=1 Tax=Acidobacteriaceae bacterium ZG23-2 TaxID=2883246 RepID=UPI00406C301C